MSGSHDHGARTSNARMLAGALVLTSVFLVIEVAAGIVTGSLALISDAAHMFTDATGLAVALAAVKIGQRPADHRRSFGYRRFEILAAAFNALLLFAVALYILYEGYQRLRSPGDIQSAGMLAVAVAGLVVNLIAMRLLASGRQDSLNVKGAYLEVWSDMLGSLGVIAAAVVIWLTGWVWVDAVVAVAIGLWVLPRSWILLRETLNILLEGVPDGIDLAAVAGAIGSVPGVAGQHDLHVWALSSDLPSLTVHIVLAGGADADETRAAVARRLDDDFHIEHVTIQTERTDCREEGGEAHIHDVAGMLPPRS